MDRPPPVRCTGRALDGRGRATGDQCGRSFKARPRHDGEGVRPPTAAEQDADARAAGWRIAPPAADGTRHAMCPRCSRPDPTTAALCQDLNRSLT
ncbi:hypothetical protein ACGFIY_21175 [Micromonospora chersina]|uniref:hypothetical protein n=1 Tax=Micromonospora chersina TaxID=47854 RepID=UPI003710A6AE